MHELFYLDELNRDDKKHSCSFCVRSPGYVCPTQEIFLRILLWRPYAVDDQEPVGCAHQMPRDLLVGVVEAG